MNQTQAIKTHLLDNQPITSMEAFEKYGCTRLSAVIFRLRRQGMDIDTIDKETINRFGDKVTFAEYRLAKTFDK